MGEKWPRYWYSTILLYRTKPAGWLVASPQDYVFYSGAPQTGLGILRAFSSRSTSSVMPCSWWPPFLTEVVMFVLTSTPPGISGSRTSAYQLAFRARWRRSHLEFIQTYGSGSPSSITPLFVRCWHIPFHFPLTPLKRAEPTEKDKASRFTCVQNRLSQL